MELGWMVCWMVGWSQTRRAGSGKVAAACSAAVLCLLFAGLAGCCAIMGSVECVEWNNDGR